MTSPAPRRSVKRIVLVTILALFLVILGVVAAILIPILTHSNTGSSGQTIPTSFESESTATGADGRTRAISVATTDGKPADLEELAPGDQVVVSGTGFDAGLGIYVGFCAIPPSPDVKPGPCLGGIPEGAEQGEAAAKEALSSAWITDDWAWRAFATQGYDDATQGSFEVLLTVPEPTVEGLECTVSRCAISTRSDHTAMKERVQDMLLPFAYRQ
ncbi:hypothetical protein [Leucobacter aridicollis]|uniref:Uncharacterized protein n=1 Tax=Leucobacter aridicollis TaxID=283878 RepID=A0A852RHY5_9MICO|nr:hypothetical protein [Leucobacter aridicollis]MBL3681180.1 hypothetical protein [Leucobacter aridicollis]NYD27804.1 hypothetical protein [Leucobacter aridicollis]